jgi:hypothetical protein
MKITLKKTAEIVRRRAGDACEAPGCKLRPDFRGLHLCHITHRKMGGRHGAMAEIIHDPRNVALLCGEHHDRLDRRQWTLEWQRKELEDYLKQLTGWHEWKEEHENQS